MEFLNVGGWLSRSRVLSPLLSGSRTLAHPSWSSECYYAASPPCQDVTFGGHAGVGDSYVLVRTRIIPDAAYVDEPIFNPVFGCSSSKATRAH